MTLPPRAPAGFLLAVTGPSGVGKTTITRLLAAGAPGVVSLTPIVTTRAPKAGDDGEYVHVEAAAFARMRERGEVVAATRIPSATEERWYGYRGEDVLERWGRGAIPVVITELRLLAGLAERFGRGAVLSVGLLPPGGDLPAMLETLRARMRARGRETSEQIEERLQNAVRDLAAFEERRDLFDALVVNDDLSAAVGRVRSVLPGFPPAPASA